MGISEIKKRIVLDNYFKTECDVNTSIREAYEKGFELGLKKAPNSQSTGKWIDSSDVYDKRAHKHDYFCLECKTHAMDFICGSEDWWCGKPPKYCPNCGAKMEVDE